MSASEFGKCEICGMQRNLIRTYFRYDINCECHSPCHFELVLHCEDCVPKAPTTTTITLKPKGLNLNQEGSEKRQSKPFRDTQPPPAPPSAQKTSKPTGESAVLVNGGSIQEFREKVEKRYSELLKENAYERYDSEKESIFDNKDYWNEDKTVWTQPPVKIKHGDLVDIEYAWQTVLGRYIGKGYGVAVFNNYATGAKYHIGRVVSRGIDRNPSLISDEELFKYIED